MCWPSCRCCTRRAPVSAPRPSRPNDAPSCVSPPGQRPRGARRRAVCPGWSRRAWDPVEVTGTAWVALVLACTAAVGDWIAVVRENKRLEYVCKPLTMVLLVVAALALDPADDAQRAWFVAAFVLSLAGDVFLMLPERPVGSVDTFVAGLVSFLLGHLAFIAGLWARGIDAGRFAGGVALVVVLMLTLGRRIVGGVRRGPDPSLVVAVTAYMIVISAMVASAIGTGVAFAIGGSLLFYCSDALIAWNRFIDKRRLGPIAIIVTYHAAQVGLLLGLV